MLRVLTASFGKLRREQAPALQIILERFGHKQKSRRSVYCDSPLTISLLQRLPNYALAFIASRCFLVANLMAIRVPIISTIAIGRVMYQLWTKPAMM